MKQREETEQIENKAEQEQAESQVQDEETIDETSTQSEQVETQRIDVDTLISENEELKDKYLRLAAEFDNYKKRQQNIFNNMLQQERDNIIGYLLSISDEIDRALKAVESDNDPAKIVEGVKAVKRKIDGLLELEQIERFGCDGELLDPLCHEAIGTEPTDSEEKDNIIVCTVSPGFKRCGKLVRPAKVIVAKFDKRK